MSRARRFLDLPEPVAILALRTPGTGKTRFAGLSRQDRADLALAMVLDAVRALRGAASEVIIVCGALEPRDRDRLEQAGCRLQPEPPAGGLNAALSAGIATLPRDTLVLAAVADLPSLTPDGVRFVTQHAHTDGPVIVPDADGVGTTMIAGPAESLQPRFGADSATRHRALGFRVLEDAPADVRRDADDVAALSAALRLGVGPATAALLRESPWWTQQVPAGEPAETCH